MPNSDFVQVATDGAGKKVDTAVLTSDAAGDPDVERQGVFIGDPSIFANKAKVDASGNISIAGTVGVSSLPGSPAQDGTDGTGITAPTGGVGIRGWLSGIYNRLSNTLTVSIAGTPSVSVSNLPGTQPVSGSVSVSNFPATQPVSGTVAVSGSVATTLSGTPAVSVSNFPGTQPVSGTVTSNDGGTPLTGQSLPTGSGIIGWLSRIYVAVTGTLTTNATIQGTPAVTVSGSVATTLSGTPAVSVSNLPATQTVSGSVSVSNFPATQPVSGTVTANAGTGNFASTVADGANTALGTTTDTSSGNTVVGILKAIKAAVQGTLTISGAVTNSNLDVALSTRLKPADTLAGVTTVAAVTAITNALPTGANTIGAVTNANLDVALSTRLKPADTLAGITTVGAVTAITNPLPAGTNAIGVVGQKAQTSLTATLASAVTTVTSTASQSLDGYDGAGTLQITAVGTVAAQAVSLQIEGSVDNANWERIAIAQIGATDSPVYSTANFTLTPGNGTISHLYAVRDTVKFIRVTTTANNLGTGLTVSCYTNPV